MNITPEYKNKRMTPGRLFVLGAGNPKRFCAAGFFSSASVVRLDPVLDGQRNMLTCIRGWGGVVSGVVAELLLL